MITDYPSAGDRYRGALLNNSTNSTSIGTMTDTVQNSAVLDPITTINSTTTTLYQFDDAQFVGYSSTETNFAGTRPADYTGPRDAQFDGSRDTDVDFAGTRAAQFAGQGVGDTQTTVETYTLYVRTA